MANESDILQYKQKAVESFMRQGLSAEQAYEKAKELLPSLFGAAAPPPAEMTTQAREAPSGSPWDAAMSDVSQVGQAVAGAASVARGALAAPARALSSSMGSLGSPAPQGSMGPGVAPKIPDIAGTARASLDAAIPGASGMILSTMPGQVPPQSPASREDIAASRSMPRPMPREPMGPPAPEAQPTPPVQPMPPTPAPPVDTQTAQEPAVDASAKGDRSARIAATPRGKELVALIEDHRGKVRNPKPSREDVADAIIESAKRNGVPPEIALSVGLHESGLDHSASGDSGLAYGWGQVNAAARGTIGLNNALDLKGYTDYVTRDLARVAKQKGQNGRPNWAAAVQSWNPASEGYSDRVLSNRYRASDIVTARASGQPVPKFGPPEAQPNTGASSGQMADGMVDDHSATAEIGPDGQPAQPPGVDLGQPELTGMDAATAAIQQHDADVDNLWQQTQARKAQLGQSIDEDEQRIARDRAEYANMRPDQMRYWKNQSGLQKALKVLSSLAGAFAEGFSQGRVKNSALAVIEQEISQDLKLQMAEIQQKGSAITGAEGILAKKYKEYGSLIPAYYSAKKALSAELNAKLQGTAAILKADARAKAAQAGPVVDAAKQSRIDLNKAKQKQVELAMRELKGADAVSYKAASQFVQQGKELAQHIRRAQLRYGRFAGAAAAAVGGRGLPGGMRIPANEASIAQSKAVNLVLAMVTTESGAHFTDREEAAKYGLAATIENSPEANAQSLSAMFAKQLRTIDANIKLNTDSGNEGKAEVWRSIRKETESTMQESIRMLRSNSEAEISGMSIPASMVKQ